MVTAREVMIPSLIHLERDTPVNVAAKLMVEKHVGSIIVTATGYPVGIVTEKDITKLVARDGRADSTTLGDIMSSPLYSTGPENELMQVAGTMAASNIKRLPVIEHQKVIGIITQTDIIRNVMHVCSRVAYDYTQGRHPPIEQAVEAIKASRVMDKEAKARYWYMRCLSCGESILNEEQNSALVITSCPRCGGKIDYDPTPRV
jgi:predicted transcriptional regulator